MRVLVACEFSGVVREAFRRRGHDAWSCDLVPAEDDNHYHYQCDVFEALQEINGWDMLIAHPPCTYLAAAGLQYLSRPGRLEKQQEAGDFAARIWHASVAKICIENPVGQLPRYIGSYSQIVRMWMFGHADAQKPTCLWLKGLPKLVASNPVTPLKSRRYPNGKVLSPWRAKHVRAVDRSRTFQGMADAMAEQWGAD